MSDVVSHVFVIHETGSVVLSRQYDNGECLTGDKQLIGAFLTAIKLFMKNFQTNYYDIENDQIPHNHQLDLIRLSCSSWFVDTYYNYTIVIIVPANSLLTQQILRRPLMEIAKQIANSFILYSSFVVDDNNAVSLYDFSEEFGATTDHLIFENIQNIRTVELMKGRNFKIEETENSSSITDNFEVANDF